MRQLEERSVDGVISDMCWSPKMDIVAVAFLQTGDVTLYRLNWQKLWTLQGAKRSKAPDGGGTSTSESTTGDPSAEVTALSWRPDGKVLAVGYDDGHLILLDIESSNPISRNRLETPVSCLNWVSIGQGNSGASNAGDSFNMGAMGEALSESSAETGKHWDFLAKFPSLSRAYSYTPSGLMSGSGGQKEDNEDCRKINDGGIVTLLMVGTKSGTVAFYINGFLLAASADLNQISRYADASGLPMTVKDIAIGGTELNTFSVLSSDKNLKCTDTDNETVRTKLMVMTMPLISTCHEELAVLSRQFSILEGITIYMEDTLKQITEAWEGILLEMDNKLEAYASKLPDATDPRAASIAMAADFLDLLTFGTPSPDLESFLLQELTEKGLKKLGHSIEVSYSNVQRLVLKYLHTGSQAMNFHLCELTGLIRASEKYSVMLGVTEANIVRVQRLATSFWCKGIELQQVIDESMKSFKAFFRWLYVEILRLSDEEINEELSQVSQNDVRYIADFLDSFSRHEDGSNPKHKNLERVGQYLKNEPLVQQVSRSNNPWHQFLKENEDTFKDIPFIIQVNEKTSLVQEFNLLKAAMNDLFTGMNTSVTDKCILQGELLMTSLKPHPEGPLSGTAPPPAVAPARYPVPTAVCSEQTRDCKDAIYGFVKLDGGRNKAGNLLFYSLEEKTRSLRAVRLTFEVQQQGMRMRHASAVSLSGGGSSGSNSCQLVDARFYTADTLSLLINPVVEEGGVTTDGHGEDEEAESGRNAHNQQLIQLSVADVYVHLRELRLPGSLSGPMELSEVMGTLKAVSVFEIAGPACHRELDRISAVQFAVSVRKVAAFLFANRKRVRIYDMEVDEDAEDEFDEENEIAGMSSSELNTSV